MSTTIHQNSHVVFQIGLISWQSHEHWIFSTLMAALVAVLDNECQFLVWGRISYCDINFPYDDIGYFFICLLSTCNSLWHFFYIFPSIFWEAWVIFLENPTRALYISQVLTLYKENGGKITSPSLWTVFIFFSLFHLTRRIFFI